VTDDPTVGACWDADRLDLPRVGVTVDPRLLSTAAARNLRHIAAVFARGAIPNTSWLRAHGAGVELIAPAQREGHPWAEGGCGRA
jgi:hypothetical protein